MLADTDAETDFLSPGATPRRWRVRAAAPPPRPGSWLRRIAGAIPAWWRRQAQLAQLQQLDDRTLTDLALNRGDFPAILAGTFGRDTGGRSAHELSAPAQRPPRAKLTRLPAAGRAAGAR